MNIARFNSAFGGVITVSSIFVLIMAIDWLTPTFETWNLRFYDALFSIRSHIALFAPAYDDTVVHVDLDDTSIQQFNTYYLNRSYHARVISNLSEMGVSAQLHDVIFAAPSNSLDDTALIDAVKASDSTYLGLAFRLSNNPNADGLSNSSAPDVYSYMKKSSWDVRAHGDPVDFYYGHHPLITFPELAESSKGLGFLNLIADHDGIFRRMPLLVSFNGAYYPSVPFRLVCDYLGVDQSNIEISPGKSITLINAKKPMDKKPRNIEIPIDKQGNMVVNFIGPWDRFNHYRFADVYHVSKDQDIWDRWVQELSNKIVVVSEVTTGSADIGSVPTDISYPLSGLLASVIHTIISGSFIKQTPTIVTLIIGIILLCAVYLLSRLSSTPAFTLLSLGIIPLSLIVAALLFLNLGFITNVITPVIMVFTAFLAVQFFRTMESARNLRQSELKRSVFEREMEIGRQIQLGFFPENLPQMEGWELSAFFRPARQVAGDFYDAFTIADGRFVGFVVADVCDKGVGAALFMALTRSLLRAFALLSLNQKESENHLIGRELVKTIGATNDYIANTHSRANMFATVFIGILDPESGKLTYINCGHEPPIVRHASNQISSLMPTGAAIGMFAGIDFRFKEIELQTGDTLVAFTDGVTDAQNEDGDLFSKEKLIQCLAEHFISAEALVDEMVQKIDQHVADAKQFDDITLMSLIRTI